MAIEKISTLVKNQFPAFYKEDGQNFLAFMEAYYEWMETNGQMSDAVRNLESWNDISTTTEEFIDYFFHTLLPSVPVEVVANKKLMAKYVREFNTSRGTLSSYKLMFRSIYNESVELNYPSEQILKVSDGDWNLEQYLVTNYNTQNYTFIGKTIKGKNSKAEALVEDIRTIVVRSRHIHQFIISNIKGIFNDKEPISIKYNNDSEYYPIIDAGINSIAIATSGGEYRRGDVVGILSGNVGDLAKVVITDTIDMGGAISFSLNDGGSGYGASTDETVWGDTDIFIDGGDGVEKGSFTIERTDLHDMFALSVNVNTLNSNTIFGNNAPVISQVGGSFLTASTFANTVLGQASFGFPEKGENVGNANYHDQEAAWITINNSTDPGIAIDQGLYGATSGANATVVSAIRGYSNNNIVLRVNGYKDWIVGETVNSFVGGSLSPIGTVGKWAANTVGSHELQLGWIPDSTINPLLDDVELVGIDSGAYGVVRKIVPPDSANPSTTYLVNGYQDTTSNTYRDLYKVYVSANSTANTSSQFDTGPMKAFEEGEGLRIVGSSTLMANAVGTTSNAVCENIHTKLSDSLIFAATYYGSIGKLSNMVGGSGYSVKPEVTVRANDVAALGIGEAYLTLQTDDLNWTSGNSQILKIDTNDRIVQSSSGASGDVKGGDIGSDTTSIVQHANGTIEMVARVWQDFLQREPGNIMWKVGDNAALKFYGESYIPGEVDARSTTGTGQATITSVVDRGVLGKNAIVQTGIGANGAISGVRVLDSGFSYLNNEEVVFESTGRNRAVSGTGIVKLKGSANSEGYYSTSRSLLSSKRSYIQDSNYYQEFSYELISPISFSRYRDIALNLCHPSGQILFGKYQTSSNVQVEISVNTTKSTLSSMEGTFSLTKPKASGTISIANDGQEVIGVSTALSNQMSNNDYIIIETDPGDEIDNLFWLTKLNVVSDSTTANLANVWSHGNVLNANVYFANTGTSHNIIGLNSNLTNEVGGTDNIFVEFTPQEYNTLKLNIVTSDTLANLNSLWIGPDFTGVNMHYTTGSF